jgi:hypothetical protein
MDGLTYRRRVDELSRKEMNLSRQDIVSNTFLLKEHTLAARSPPFRQADRSRDDFGSACHMA